MATCLRSAAIVSHPDDWSSQQWRTDGPTVAHIIRHHRRLRAREALVVPGLSLHRGGTATTTHPGYRGRTGL